MRGEQLQHTERRHPRFRLNRSQELSVGVEFEEGGEVQQRAAAALDFSEGGLKLQMSTPLPIKQILALQLNSDELEREIHAQGHVCWGRPIGPEEWWIGIAFEEPLPPETLDRLCRLGYVDRRRDRRDPRQVHATARWELAAASVDVEVVDLSAGGFAIRSPQAATIGDRLLLSPDPGNPRQEPILAKIRWQREVDDEFMIGCGFLEPHAFARLRHALGEVDDETPRRQRPSARQLLVFVACIAVSAVTAVMLWRLG